MNLPIFRIGDVVLQDKLFLYLSISFFKRFSSLIDSFLKFKCVNERNSKQFIMLDIGLTLSFEYIISRLLQKDKSIGSS